jgi:hypothetical protein
MGKECRRKERNEINVQKGTKERKITVFLKRFKKCILVFIP